MNTFSLTPLSEDLDWHLLTTCEWKVLLLLADDHDNCSVAVKTGVSPKSVENYITRLGAKLSMKGQGVLARNARFHRAQIRELHWKHTGKLSPPPLKVTLSNCWVFLGAA